jgi:hypothetical protein
MYMGKYELLIAERRLLISYDRNSLFIGTLLLVAIIFALSCYSAHEYASDTTPSAISYIRETNFCEIINAPEQYKETKEVSIANASLTMVAGFGLSVDSEPSCTVRYSLIDVDISDSFIEDACSRNNEELCVVAQHVAKSTGSPKGSASVIRGTLQGRVQAYHAPEAVVFTRDHIRFRFTVLQFATVDSWSAPIN